jgi:hypothetical protein
MGTSKKHQKSMLEVHILGDLRDVVSFIDYHRKKKTIFILKDAEKKLFYIRTKDKIKKISAKEIAKIEKKHRLILISFFPGQKKAEPEMEESPGTPVAVKTVRTRKPVVKAVRVRKAAVAAAAKVKK